MARQELITLEFNNYIESAPHNPQSLYAQACSNDSVTVDSWRPVWVKNIKENKAKFGSFNTHRIGKIFGEFRNKPVIVAGSGPSLKYNGKHLKDRGADVGLVSCLHNFHFMEDNGANVDYYVTLDAGDVTVEEVSEGGTKSEAEYWAMTKGRKLIAYIATSPKLLEKWQGEIYFYNAPLPDAGLIKEILDIEKFNSYVSTGGNVLGACLYIAKGYLGAGVVGFVGADFSFSYDRKFHGWDSKYDKVLGNTIRMVDIYGNKCLTWQSYANFKAWFDWVALSIPGIYINCTEGGTFGAYPEGNVMAVKQMELTKFIEMFTMSEKVRPQAENPEIDERLILF